MADEAELSNETRERRRRHFGGLAAEGLAALWLALKGYRILGRRVKTPAGEIDLIAMRGKRLAFVEVKRRRDGLAAEASILPRQRQRVRRAAELWLKRRPALQGHEMGFDVVFLMPWRVPRHIENGLRDHETL